MTDYFNAVGEEHVRRLADRMAELLRAELPHLDHPERAIAAAALASTAQRLDGLREFGDPPFKLGGVTAGFIAIAETWKVHAA